MLKFDEIAKMQEVRTGLVESDLEQAIRWQVRRNSLIAACIENS